MIKWYKKSFYKSYMTYKSYLCLSFAFGFCFAKKCRGVDEADICWKYGPRWHGRFLRKTVKRNPKNKIRKQAKTNETIFCLNSESFHKLFWFFRSMFRHRGGACAFCCRREKQVVFFVPVAGSAFSGLSAARKQTLVLLPFCRFWGIVEMNTPERQIF